MECGWVFIKMSWWGFPDWILSKWDPTIGGMRLFLHFCAGGEKKWKRKKTPTKVFFSWTQPTERPVSLTRAQPFGWINLAAAQIKCFNWLREYRRLKAARTDPPVNETWIVSRCFNEHRTCWNLVYHLQHCQRCRLRVWLSPCLMQQWRSYHLTTLQSILSFKLGFFLRPPCLTAPPASHHVQSHVEEQKWHECKSQTQQAGAQWPAMLPVNKDTEVEFVELRVWSRTPYLILRILDIKRLVSMKALRDQDGGLRAGSPHRWS